MNLPGRTIPVSVLYGIVCVVTVGDVWLPQAVHGYGGFKADRSGALVQHFDYPATVEAGRHQIDSSRLNYPTRGRRTKGGGGGGCASGEKVVRSKAKHTAKPEKGPALRRLIALSFYDGGPLQNNIVFAQGHVKAAQERTVRLTKAILVLPALYS